MADNRKVVKIKEDKRKGKATAYDASRFCNGGWFNSNGSNGYG